MLREIITSLHAPVLPPSHPANIPTSTHVRNMHHVHLQLRIHHPHIHIRHIFNIPRSSTIRRIAITQTIIPLQNRQHDAITMDVACRKYDSSDYVGLP